MQRIWTNKFGNSLLWDAEYRKGSWTFRLGGLFNHHERDLWLFGLVEKQHNKYFSSRLKADIFDTRCAESYQNDVIVEFNPFVLTFDIK
jgi:hypothetical protein